MDWVTALPKIGDKSHNACLVIVDRYSKTPIFLPCHKDETSMNKTLILLTYHPQTDRLAERMIQTLEDIIRIFCAYGLEFKDSDGLNHYWCTLILPLELEYKTSVNSSTEKTPDMLEKGWNPRLPADTLRKDFIKIHPTASSFKVRLDKVKHNAKQSINDASYYAKQKWEKSHKVPDFKVGDLGLVSTLNSNNIKGPNQVELSGEFENKHPTFAVSLIKPYQPADKELFPLRNPAPLTLPPVEQSEDNNIKKFIKERKLRGKNQREYLVRYRNPVHEDEWM
ncbi:hypothetical protein O181_097163 [Austropuccinia psidii MF-1]|uniref:Uncharacterized protein n=1 Tax=Austropuccinia psidii MF-1 TaxID=1389203 RepID=A0A9Q3PCW8_9BASI|nr:hypothetical protein [Austropuccinia psidii MF-1]